MVTASSSNFFGSTVKSLVFGQTLAKSGIDPQLDFRGKVKQGDGTEVEVATAWNLYRVHLQDYDLDTVSEITSAPKPMVLVDVR